MIDTALDRLRRHQTALSVAVLAVLAYVPSLRAAPGRMPTDSKLYVYLDPGRFVADTTTTFDPRQFAGWVPHQHIAYLWPTGPWYWLFEALGVPDWVAHRLWIATLLFVAGLGVRWMTRVLGFAPLAALAAALVYQLSPYVLPYISRTSVLLLPFAGLGWIVGLTVRASRRGDLAGKWRDPALIALVVLTVGAVNATALAMVIPAPVLWLVHVAWQRTVTTRHAVATAARTALLCIGVSLWWIMMLVIQGRHGADVLAYSESLEAVSFTSTSTEVTRGLGYWLFYVRDAYSAATSASFDHLVSGRTVFAGFLVVVLGLVGLVSSRWEHRRFAGLAFGAGVILGVGVHPIDDPSPLMSLLVGDGEGGLALALRSSTRAVPVMLIGVSLGVASLVTAVGRVTAQRFIAGTVRASGVEAAGVRAAGIEAAGVEAAGIEADRVEAAGVEADRVEAAGVRRKMGSRRTLPALARLATAGLVGLVAIVGLPALRNGGFVDPALERDQDPPQAWIDATADLDARPHGYRVLQVPGAEFGAFQWGYTVDQPLPGLTDRPLITRDLLPLGSPAAMDLAFALDDRIQTDTIEPAAVATVARLLGVDTIWVSGDVAYDRFQLARPEVVTAELTSPRARDAGLAGSTPFGDAVVMESRIPMIDDRSLSDRRIGAPIAPITLVDVADPIPTVRVKDTVVVLSGSGDGIIDAAAAGLLDGTEAVLYSASIDADDVRGVDRFVLTDSNRDRGHHWRSSQDVVGFTESAATDSDVLRFESGDQRLPVFVDAGMTPDADTQTVSIQDGPVTARASGYGERFAYVPEHRPVMAIDGDLETAWLVADRAPAVGEFIELLVAEPVDHVTLLQPAVGAGQRTITAVDISVDDRSPMRVALDDSSRSGDGQRIDVPPTSDDSTIVIAIAATSDPQPPIGEAIGGVGFVEIDVGLSRTTEFIRPPIDAVTAMGDRVEIVLTRLRVEPTDRWRDDPEPRLVRRFSIGSELTFVPNVTLRLDQRLADQQLADLLGEQAVGTSRLPGAPSTRGAAAFDGDDTTAWTTPFGRAVGESVHYSGAGSARELTIAQPGGDHSPITRLRVIDDTGDFVIDVPPGADAVVSLPREISLVDVRFEIVAIDERVILNRRFNEPQVLPAAVSEVRFDDVSPSIVPDERLAASCRTDLLAIDGEPVPLSFDVSTADALAGHPIDATVCTAAVPLSAGAHDLQSTPGGSGFDVDRVVLRSSELASEPNTATGGVDPSAPIVLDGSSRHRTVEVPACPDGCWLVHGEGFNDAWTATVAGASLGKPVLIDGNANGWWIAPSDAVTVVEIDWPVQRGLNIALALTLLSVLVCVGLIVRRRSAPIRAPWRGRRSSPEDDHLEHDDLAIDDLGIADLAIDDLGIADLGIAEAPEASGPAYPMLDAAHHSVATFRADVGPYRRRSLVVSALLATVAAAVMVDWIWAPGVALVWAVGVVLRRPAVVGWIGLAVIIGSAAAVTQVVRTEEPYPDAGWPVRFEWLHGWTLFGVVLVTTCCLAHARWVRDETRFGA